MYDWANSSYATIVVAAVFPIYFTSVAGAATGMGDFWWGIGTSIATGILALSAPLLGALADYRGYKKPLFAILTLIGVLFTVVCALFDNWQLMLVGYVISHIGWSGGNLVYDSFLTDVTEPERMDHLSSLGYAMGYIGGSTIPFVMSIVLITFGDRFGVDTTLAVKLSLIICAVWWAVFTIPFLRDVKQRFGSDKPRSGFVKHTFGQIVSTLRSIIANKAVWMFVLAYFFYIDGVGTVIGMATSYGTVLNLDSSMMIIALMVTQLVAFPCSILFGRMSIRFGSLRMIIGAICMYIFICVLGFLMGFGLEEGFLTIAGASVIFWCLAVLVGTVQGGIQAISRSYYGKIIPPERSGEYFGFLDIFGKFAAVLGPLLYAFTRGVTGRSSLSILAIILLFIAGLVVLMAGRKHLRQ